MSDKHPAAIDPVAAALTTANIRLAGRFLRELIDDPARLDRIPDGTAIILLPHDEPDLAQANVGMALRLAEERREVHTEQVGVPLPDDPQWRATQRTGIRVRSVAPRWPAESLDPRELVVVYDRQRDVLLTDFFAGRRLGEAIPVNQFAFYRIDRQPQEIIGHLVPDFLAVAVRKAPRLATILALAELRSLTSAEMVGINDPVGPLPDEAVPPPNRGLVVPIVEEFVDSLRRMPA